MSLRVDVVVLLGIDDERGGLVGVVFCLENKRKGER